MGFGARRFGPAQGAGDFLCVFLGSGIGAALFIEGRACRGGLGLSGELGHVTVAEDGPWCNCGSRGCLEMKATTDAILAQVRARLIWAHLVSQLGDSHR
jgi:glucokinase